MLLLLALPRLLVFTRSCGFPRLEFVQLFRYSGPLAADFAKISLTFSEYDGLGGERAKEEIFGHGEWVFMPARS